MQDLVTRTAPMDPSGLDVHPASRLVQTCTGPRFNKLRLCIAGIMAGAILDSAAALFTAVPFEVQLGGHCLIVAHLCKHKFENKFALNCVVGFIFAFGGGLVTSLLLQVRALRRRNQPARGLPV